MFIRVRTVDTNVAESDSEMEPDVAWVLADVDVAGPDAGVDINVEDEDEDEDEEEDEAEAAAAAGVALAVKEELTGDDATVSVRPESSVKTVAEVVAI